MIDSSIMNLMMELATFSFIVPLVLIIVWKLRTPQKSDSGLYRCWYIFCVCLCTRGNTTYLFPANQ